MDSNQIVAVTASFEEIVLTEDTVAALFYGRLFELDPDMRILFHNDMRIQGHRFMDMLHLIIHSLDAPDRLMPELRALGQRHREYGVRGEHYATVGAALLWALRQGLGNHFTPDSEKVWVALFAFVADTMQAI